MMAVSRRIMLLSGSAAATLAALASGVVPGDAEARATPAAWKLPERRPVRIIETQWIAMKDGARLAARVWIPDGADHNPVPVVWEYLPYRLWDGLRWRDDKTADNLAPYGIAFVRVDIRGTGNSEGVMVDEYDTPELSDGVEIIDWLSRQPWSNGSVGMRGISWGGINALQIAAMNPPRLKAIMPMGCCDNRYTDDAHYTGGAYAYQNIAWGTTFKGHMAGPPDPQVVGPRWEAMWRERLAATPPIEHIWSTHQRYDAYWRRGSVAADYAAIKCPVYLVDGWGDPYSNTIGRLLANLTSPRKGLIGPWGHIFPNIATPLGLEWAHEEVRWWRHWLMGVDTGLMDEPMLRVYMMDKADSEAFPDEVPGRWVAEDVWPAAHPPSRLYFNAGGRLSEDPGEKTSMTYVGDRIVGLTKPQWIYGRPTELEQTPDDLKSLLFDSEPLNEDLEILGYPIARIRVGADVPVAKIAVRLTEVTPDGKSWLVTYNLLNLTRRDSIERPVPLEPGEFYDIELRLYMIAHRFKKGSRIRVAISENLWPLVWPSPHIATLRIELGASHIVLPVREPPPVEAPFTIPVIHGAPTAISNRAVIPAPDPEGWIDYQRNSPPTPTLVAAVGTTVSNGVTEVLRIKEGDAGSCLWRLEHSTSWSRGDWNCTVTFGAQLTGTPEDFRLEEWLSARKADDEIFRRETSSTIPRDLL